MIASLLLLLCFTFTQTSDLSNADVIQMTQAGLSAEVIVAKIKSSRSAFDTSPTALAELKSKGVAQAVLIAMTVQEVPTKPQPAIAETQAVAVKALRRLANAIEIGVSYVDYGPLVAEAKTEIETALERGVSDQFKEHALRAMYEYQFAADVWHVYRDSDVISGYYADTATKQYGVKKSGWLKLVSRNEFLRAIWREARRHYEAAVYSDGPAAKPTTPTETLRGVWVLQAVSPSGQPVKLTLTVFDGARLLGHLQQDKTSNPIQRLSLEGNRFHIETKGKGKPILNGVFSENRLKGTISLKTDKNSITLEFVGTRQP